MPPSHTVRSAKTSNNVADLASLSSAASIRLSISFAFTVCPLNDTFPSPTSPGTRVLPAFLPFAALPPPPDSRCGPPLPSSRANLSRSSRRPAANCPAAIVCGGRQRSTPGTALNVAACSVTTRARSTLAVGHARKNSAQARRQSPASTSSLPQAAKLPGGTDDDLQVIFARPSLAAIENPLADAVHQHDVRQGQHRTIVPDVHAGDRRRFQVAQVAEARRVARRPPPAASPATGRTAPR